MALISPRQEEASVIKKVRSILQQKGVDLDVLHISTINELTSFVKATDTTNHLDFVCLSTSYTHEQLITFMYLLLRQVKRQVELFSLIYIVNWEVPLQTILGTHWCGQIGILHTDSSVDEVAALFMRLQLLYLPSTTVDHPDHQ